MKCKNCGESLIETSKGNYLHEHKITAPINCIGAVKTSRVTGCAYPEPAELELVDNVKREFKEKIIGKNRK